MSHDRKYIHLCKSVCIWEILINFKNVKMFVGACGTAILKINFKKVNYIFMFMCMNVFNNIGIN